MPVLVLDALIVVLVATAPVAIERLRGLEHAAGDLSFMFIPDFAWWWSVPRWLGGWNPWVFGGFPSNADPLVGHVHPLGLLWAAFSPLTASALEGAVAPALAGVGMLVYLRSIGCARAGALVGALAFACGGYVHAHAMHPEKLRSVLAIPWALAAIEALRGRRLVAGLGAAVAVMVAGGHPQTIAFSLALVAIYGIVFATGRRAVLAALALGVAVPAVTWLPAIELVRLSQHVNTVIAGVDHLGAACAPALVVPFGCGGGAGPFYGRSIERFPGCGIIDCTGYPGMLVWLLLLAGVPRLLATSRGRFWIAVGVAGLVLSTDVMERLLPIPGVRAPARALLWWNIASAAAAALVLRRDGQPARRAWWGAALVLLCVVALASTRDAVARRAAIGSLAVLCATIVAASAPGRAPAVAVLIVDLVLFGSELHAGAPRGFIDAARSELRRADGLRRTGGDPAADHGRVLAVPALSYATWAQIERVPMLQGWNVLVPRAFTRLLNGSRTSPLGYDFAVVQDPALFATGSHVLDLLRARIVLVPERTAREPAWASALVEPRWKTAGASTRWRYVSNERARPVGWLVHRVRVVGDDEALALVRGEAGRFDPALEALAQEPLVVAAATAPEDVRLVRYDDDVIALHVRASAAALLVSSELAYPGWVAQMDGREVPVRTVDAGFRAVEVPAGEFDVTFRYRPTLGRVGLGLGIVAAVVLLLCAM